MALRQDQDPREARHQGWQEDDVREGLALEVSRVERVSFLVAVMHHRPNVCGPTEMTLVKAKPATTVVRSLEPLFHSQSTVPALPLECAAGAQPSPAGPWLEVKAFVLAGAKKGLPEAQ